MGHLPVGKICIVCGDEFVVRFNRMYTAKFCSRECMGAYRKGKLVVGFIHIKGVRSNTGRTHFKKGNIPNNYKGDEVSYNGLHKWIHRHKGRPTICQMCGSTTAKKFEWANKSHLYKRDEDDWLSLCTKCHHTYDNIAEKRWATRRTNEQKA